MLTTSPSQQQYNVQNFVIFLEYEGKDSVFNFSSLPRTEFLSPKPALKLWVFFSKEDTHREMVPMLDTAKPCANEQEQRMSEEGVHKSLTCFVKFRAEVQKKL